MDETEKVGNFWERAPLTNFLGDKTYAFLAWLMNFGPEKVKVDKIHFVEQNATPEKVLVDERSPKYRLVPQNATEEELVKMRIWKKYSY